MAPSPRHRYRRSSAPAKRFRRWFSRPTRIPTGLLCLNGLIYGGVGAIIAAFPVPLWVWGLVLGGTTVQALTLAGPQSLARFRWWGANALALLAILGAGSIVIGLSIALGYAGTDNLDLIVPQEIGIEVLRMSMIALLITGLGAIVSATVGDRLLTSYNHFRTTLIIAVSSFSGLGIGSLIGWLIAVA